MCKQHIKDLHTQLELYQKLCENYESQISRYDRIVEAQKRLIDELMRLNPPEDPLLKQGLTHMDQLSKLALRKKPLIINNRQTTPEEQALDLFKLIKIINMKDEIQDKSPGQHNEALEQVMSMFFYPDTPGAYNPTLLVYLKDTNMSDITVDSFFKMAETFAFYEN
jgi:hypothetical protein